MNSQRVTGVVFDFGGVMTTTTMPERVRRLVGELGVDWGVLERGFAKYRRLMDGDFMTMEEMYSRIWSDGGVTLAPEIQAKIISEDQASYLYRNEKTLEWMRSLKARGFKIGILTNMATSFAPLFREYFHDFIALADAMVISGEAKMYKPEKCIFELLRSRIAVPAEELVFIDDVEANCEGARLDGWRAIRFVDNAQVAADLEQMIAG